MPDRPPGDLPARLQGLSPDRRARLLEALRRERLREAEGGTVPARPPGDPPLSLPQERLWFLERLAPGASGYHVPAAWRLTGRLDYRALSRGLAEIERRHEALRTRFASAGERPVQVVSQPRDAALPLIDLAGLCEDRGQEEARRIGDLEALRAFDLDLGPLWRALLFRRAGEEHVLLLTLHHIIADGWSLGVLVSELSALYDDFAAGRPSRLPELPIQYGDFAAWQRRRWEEGAFSAQLAGWAERLAGSPTVLDLPADRPRPAVQTRRGAVLPAALPARVWQACEALGRRLGATPFMVGVAAFATLLGRITGQEDLLVGSPSANRQPAETEGLIGFFVNTLVLRFDLTGAPSFADLLGRVREAALAAQAHGEVPFEKLVEALRPRRDLSVPPLVQVVFAFEGAPAGPPAFAGMRIERFPIGAAVAPFDLTLNVVATEEGLRGWWVYSTDLFDGATVRRWNGAWERLLTSVIERPEACLSDLPLLSAAERQQALFEWNDTGVSRGTERFHGLLETWARRTPAAPAVVSGTEQLGYGELHRRVGRLADRLRSHGVGLEVVVAVCLESSPEAVVAMLAVLAAGGVYLPLDPAYPAERLAFMLEDSGAALVVTREPLRLPAGGLPRLQLDGGGPAPSGAEVAPPARSVPGGAAAYAIYTSGSTGRPKGVVVSHRALANLVTQVRSFGLGPGDRVLQFSSLSFDASIFHVAMALGTGAALVVADPGSKLPGPALARLIVEQRVSAVLLPPSALAALPAAALPGLRLLISGGEALPADLVERWAPGRVFFNAYGPTEVTVWATCEECRAGGGRPAIGRPVAGAEVYLLDPRMAALPPGVTGEVYVGGAGVARGYLGRPERTAEGFLPDPWSGRPGARLYRTGDLARRLPDGRLEFLGRADAQVKVRGFRVEPGEIEAVLRGHPAVLEAVVALHDEAPGGRSGSPGLVAWVMAREDGAEPWEALIPKLRSQLRERLPQHMMPAALVRLERLPLLPSGKVNRKALPSPAESLAEHPAGLPPRDEIERLVATAWREALGIDLDRVGIDDNFFDLGGHSLLLVRVHARLAERFPGLAVIDLFKHPTVRSLARRLRPKPAVGAELGPSAPPAAARPASVGAVAVIGLAGRFPGSPGVEAFWRNLCDGVESISFFTDDELAAGGVEAGSLSDPRYVRANGVLEGADRFDAELFGIAPREADVMDPQHRLLLEAAWEALEDAGCEPRRIGGRVGVFAGVSANTYLRANVASNREALASVGAFQAAISNQDPFAVTRIAYKLDLRGPCVHLQTACSTSLVAVHLACRSLLTGECDVALAGGAGIAFPQRVGYLYEERGIASPDGHCRAFDAQAAGTVGGNGVGLVVLKRLADALEDGDRIRAVIRGTAVNNDGAGRVGYTAPSVNGQAEVIAAALAAAELEPKSIGYVEAHGSGTALGDPIEVAALNQVFGAAGGRNSCALASVKTNIGHLDAAAGIAGLIKAVLAVERGIRPPSLHFERPNPAIDLEAGPFFVPTVATPWPPGLRRAGVSSFGMGGTNAHVVLEEPPPQPPRPNSRPCHLVMLSARTPAALDAATARLADHLSAQPHLDPADVTYTLQTGRRGFDHRRILVARDLADMAGALAPVDPGRVVTAAVGSRDRPVALLFPGLGDVQPGMFRDLYRSEPRFRQEVERCAELLPEPIRGCLPELFSRPGAPDDGAGLGFRGLVRPREAPATEEWWIRTEFSQPALFVAEYALARLWMGWGLRVQALLGYSLGDYVAACLAGVLDLEEALPLVADRARLLGSLPAGAMLAVPMAEESALNLPEVAEGAVSLAAVNGPEISVLAGDPEAVSAIERRLLAQGVPCQRLAASRAFHSPAVEPIRGPFLERLRSVMLKPPRLPVLSGVTGGWLTPEQATDPEFWYDHTRRPVRLAAGLGELLRGPDCVLLEVGPGQALSTLALQHPDRSAGQVVVTSAPHRHDRRSDAAALLEALGRLWLAGVEVDWSRFHAAEPRRKVPLPTYPFEHRRHWIEPRRDAPGDGRVESSRRLELSDWFHAPAWKPAPRPSRIAGAPQRWLLLGEAGGLGEALAAELRRRGCEAVRVESASVQDPAALLTDLRDRDLLPGGVVHLEEAGPEGPPEAARAETGLLGLLELARALGARASTEPIELAVVTAGARMVSGDERLAPERAALAGACRVIPQEYEGLACRSIDLPLPASADSGRELAGALADELLAGPANPAVAWRGGRRWVEGYARVPLDAPPEPDSLPLRQRGIYLITGGIGAIGLALAGFLARQVRARLALVSRTPLPPRERWGEWLEGPGKDPARDRTVGALRRILEIEELGAEVLPLTSDVSDVRSMRETIDQVRRRFGEIDGVIHAAGVPGGGLIQLREPSAAVAVLAPKVRGAFVLAELLRDRRLDFLALCSSLTSILGGVGQADYCAANAVLDTFAPWYEATTGTPTVAIGWDAWKDAGMAIAGVSEERTQELLAGELRDKLTSTEGVEAFRRILGAGLPHVLVSTRNFEGYLAEARGIGLSEVAAYVGSAGRSKQLERSAHPRPALAHPYVEPRDATERRLAALWGEILGIENVGIHDELTELGGHSLMALRILWRMRDELGVELPIGALFEAPTVAAMAETLAAGVAPSRRAPVSPLVPLQREGSGAPLFLVHPAGGGVSSYRDLARRLGPDWPVWGLQAPGLVDGGDSFADVETTAARYIEAVRSAAPAGPYLLGAWSLGGVVAFEMAQQLRAHGEVVGLLALIDAHVPVFGAGGLDEQDDPSLLSDLLGLAPAPGSLDAVLTEARRTGRIGEDFGLLEAERLLRVFKANVAAVHSYVPRTFPGSITLLRCRQTLAGAPPEPTLGWEAFAEGGVEVHWMPGDHGNLVFEPHAAVLAERLRACLAAASSLRGPAT